MLSTGIFLRYTNMPYINELAKRTLSVPPPINIRDRLTPYSTGVEGMTGRPRVSQFSLYKGFSQVHYIYSSKLLNGEVVKPLAFIFLKTWKRSCRYSHVSHGANLSLIWRRRGFFYIYHASESNT